MIVFTRPPIQSVCRTEHNMRWTDLSPNESNLFPPWKLRSQKFCPKPSLLHPPPELRLLRFITSFFSFTGCLQWEEAVGGEGGSIWSMESCCSQFFYEDDSDANNSQLSHWWYIALTSSHRRSQTILASVSGFGQIRFWKETIRISWSVFLIVNKSVVTGSVCHSEHQNHSNHCNALLHSAQNNQI